MMKRFLILLFSVCAIGCTGFTPVGANDMGYLVRPITITKSVVYFNGHRCYIEVTFRDGSTLKEEVDYRVCGLGEQGLAEAQSSR